MSNANRTVAPDLEAALALQERIWRACLTLRCLPSDGPRAFYSTWPAYVREYWDWGNEARLLSDSDIVRRLLSPPRYEPTPREIDTCLPTLSLLAGVTKAQRRVVAARASQWWRQDEGGWRAVGRAAGVSHSTARRIHWQAIVSAYVRSVSPREM